jgi:hypothetical protein
MDHFPKKIYLFIINLHIVVLILNCLYMVLLQLIMFENVMMHIYHVYYNSCFFVYITIDSYSIFYINFEPTGILTNVKVNKAKEGIIHLSFYVNQFKIKLWSKQHRKIEDLY